MNDRKREDERLPNRNFSRRRLLRNVGVSVAFGTVASTGMAAAEEDSEEFNTEKEPINRAELKQIQEKILSSEEYQEIRRKVAKLDGVTTTNPTVTGFTITDNKQENQFKIVHFDFTEQRDTLLAGIAWTNSDEGQRIFARVAGTGATLNSTVSVLQKQKVVKESTDPGRIRIERFIEPNNDYAVVSILPESESATAEVGISDIEHFGTADLNDGSVTTQSTTSFVNCVFDGAGGLLTGGAACAVTCRDGCFKRPNYLGCIVCAGCAAVIACYLGKCADQHLRSAFCNSAIIDCVAPIPFPAAGGCGVAYGCVIGNCNII